MTSTPAPRQLSDRERLDWLRLTRCENVGPITFFALLRRFGSAAAALEALPDLAHRGGRSRPIAICPPGAAEHEIAETAAAGARLVAWGEPDYPNLLCSIEDAPPVLSVKGHAGLGARHGIAIIGARNASALGVRFARTIAAELAGAGLVVVSGLARGIDAAAHHGALSGGTVAVLGGGIDIVYPPENAELQSQIAAQGLLVAEMPVGTEPRAQHFPRRNRIISGMSLGILVVEAATRSGSLITARCALDQGREVLAVPGSPLDPRCRGTNDLIRQGATLVETADDVLNLLQPKLRATLNSPPVPTLPAAPMPGADDKILDAARPALRALLSPSPVAIDELVRQSGLPPAIVLTLLLEMELAGLATRHPGNAVSRLA